MSKVKNPDHYKLEGIEEYETIDFIRAVLGKEGFIQYCRGTILEYIVRADKKGGEEDLRKAGEFMNYIIEELDSVEKAGELLKASLPDDTRSWTAMRHFQLKDGDQLYRKEVGGVTTYVILKRYGELVMECNEENLRDMVNLYFENRGDGKC